MRRAKKGFTLIELLASMLLSTIVLVGIISLATNMIRYQFESMKRGEVSGLNLVALASMHRQLEDATYLQNPVAGTPSGLIRGCEGYSSNWTSPGVGAQMTDMPALRSFVYCVDTAVACAPEMASYASAVPAVALCPTLWHYEFPATCPPPAVGTCGATVAGVTPDAVVYKNFFRGDDLTKNYFARNDVTGGVEVYYTVGLSSPSANRPNPIAYKVNTRIGMVKSYGTPD